MSEEPTISMATYQELVTQNEELYVKVRLLEAVVDFKKRTIDARDQKIAKQDARIKIMNKEITNLRAALVHVTNAFNLAEDGSQQKE